MDNLGRLRWGVLALLVVLAVASAGWALARNGDFEGAALNLGTELIGAVLTYALFRLIIERREKREARKKVSEAKKTRLVAEMSSRVNDVAVAAAEEVGREDWHHTDLLEGADLALANLSKAWLVSFNLRGVRLGYADLSGAVLAAAELTEADLDSSDLEEAELTVADLSHASLRGANLKDAHLAWSKLEGANFEGADLTRASLENSDVSDRQLAQMLSLAGAILPDGTQLSEEGWEAEFEDWRRRQQDSQGH